MHRRLLFLFVPAFLIAVAGFGRAPSQPSREPRRTPLACQALLSKPGRRTQDISFGQRQITAVATRSPMNTNITNLATAGVITAAMDRDAKFNSAAPRELQAQSRVEG